MIFKTWDEIVTLAKFLQEAHLAGLLSMLFKWHKNSSHIEEKGEVRCIVFVWLPIMSA